MDNSFVGVVYFIDDTKVFGQKGFKKRTVVFENEEGNFSNFVPFDFTRDGCEAVDKLSVGDKVQVFYKLKGRKWQKDEDSEVKFFLSAEAVKYDVLEKANPVSDTVEIW